MKCDKVINQTTRLQPDYYKVICLNSKYSLVTCRITVELVLVLLHQLCHVILFNCKYRKYG